MNKEELREEENTRRKSAARTVLLMYMKRYSEEKYHAGWLIDLEKIIFRSDETAQWLRQEAGGYWAWDEGEPGPSFRED